MKPSALPVAKPRRARKPAARRGQPVTHIFSPFGTAREIGRARKGESVQQFIDRAKFDTTALPTVLTCDGLPYSRRDWHEITITDYTVVEFLSYPGNGGQNGGGGKQLLGLVAAIALMVVAPLAANLAFASYGAWAVNAATAVIMTPGARDIAIIAGNGAQP